MKVSNNIEKKDFKFSVIDNNNDFILPNRDEVSVRSKEYVNWGSDNTFPNFLLGVSDDNSVVQSICNGTVDFILGNGINTNEALNKLRNKMNGRGDTIEDVIKDISHDLIIYNGYALQIIYNPLGEIIEIYPLPFDKVRSDKENNTLFYSNSWGKWNSKAISYPKYNENKKEGSQILYYKGDRRGTYPTPKWISALKSAEVLNKISDFHLNTINNNFTISAIINFNNGNPSDDVKASIEDKIKDKFVGTKNSGKFMLSFNDNKESATTVERLDDENFDEKFLNLKSTSREDIFIAFRAQQNLFGLDKSGTGFSEQEYNECFELYNRTVVVSMQNEIIKSFDKLFGANSISFNKFSLNTEE